MGQVSGFERGLGLEKIYALGKSEVVQASDLSGRQRMGYFPQTCKESNLKKCKSHLIITGRDGFIILECYHS